MSAIYKKEIKSSLCNMTGIIFITYILVLFGLYTFVVNFVQGLAEFEYTVSAVGFISLIALPLLTMKSFAEEKSTNTDQLLYSLPISTTSVVIAKFLAMASVFAIPVIFVAFYPFILSIYGTVYLNTAISTLIAYFFLGCSLISIGMFISSLTESTVIAAVLNIGAIILIYFTASIADILSTEAYVSLICIIVVGLIIAYVAYRLTKNYIVGISLAVLFTGGAAIVYIADSALFEGLFPDILERLDVFSKTNAFVNGIFDVPSIIFYLSVTAFFIFLTVQSMEKKRWN